MLLWTSVWLPYIVDVSWCSVAQSSWSVKQGYPRMYILCAACPPIIVDSWLCWPICGWVWPFGWLCWSTLTTVYLLLCGRWHHNIESAQEDLLPAEIFLVVCSFWSKLGCALICSLFSQPCVDFKATWEEYQCRSMLGTAYDMPWATCLELLFVAASAGPGCTWEGKSYAPRLLSTNTEPRKRPAKVQVSPKSTSSL